MVIIHFWNEGEIKNLYKILNKFYYFFSLFNLRFK